MALFDDLFANTGSAGADSAIQLSAAGALTNAAGQAMGAASHYEYGQQAAQAAQFQAAQLRQNAGQAMASSQRSAEDVQRQTQLVTSRALAAAGASGGGVSDPGVVSLISKYAQEGAYKSAVALYGGDERARAMGLQADAKDYEGKNTELNSDMVGAGQLFGSATTLMKGQQKDASLYQRFGAGAPTAAAGGTTG